MSHATLLDAPVEARQTQARLYSSISAGISALSGPLHGGANQKVIEMLERIAEQQRQSRAEAFHRLARIDARSART